MHKISTPQVPEAPDEKYFLNEDTIGITSLHLCNIKIFSEQKPPSSIVIEEILK